MNILKSKFNDISNKDLYIVTFLSAISFLLTIIFSKDFFIRDISYEKYIYIYAIAELLCFIIITLFWTGFVFIIKSLKNGNERVKSFVKYFIPYFILMLVVLIFTYPGIFKGDEFYLIQSAIKLKFQYTQHYFTDLFYIICLMIYPAMATITLVQVFIISTIISKTMQEAETLFNNKKLVWIFYIPLLFLPVIDNNLFPLRNSIITYLFLRTILRIWICIKEEVTTWKNWMEIFILTAIISAIKTEYIYLILIVPITFKVISNTDWTKTLIICLSIILAVKIINIPQHDNKNNTYVLTTLFNPLSMIISSDNVRGINGNDVKTINQVTNYEILKNHASFLNIPVYFSSYTNIKQTSFFF